MLTVLLVYGTLTIQNQLIIHHPLVYLSRILPSCILQILLSFFSIFMPVTLEILIEQAQFEICRLRIECAECALKVRMEYENCRLRVGYVECVIYAHEYALWLTLCLIIRSPVCYIP